MQRNSQGEAKGMLLAASDKSAYLALLAGEEVVALTKDGIQHRLNKPEHLQELKANGTVAHGTPGTPHDASQPSDNLFMVYSVSPFDPIKKGVYDDLMLRLTDVGSSPEIDIVAMHSDLPEKRNLRVDRVQPGKLESLKQMPPETVMSDPKVFEDFIAETLLANQTDGKIRLFVGGHGGAEKGLLPDGKHNNADANHAMSVDAFAEAIHKAVDRVEAETGKRPFIDNLMLCSCLMGNTSFIDALSQTGDIGVLCASPELMQGSNPNSVVEFLHDPKTSKSSGEEFAKFLVDTISEAPSAPGGSKESHHADTYGAYRLDKRLARQFRDSSEAFFQACLDNPKEAAAIKRAIASTPTYGINPFLNLMFDVDNRDVIQVAERIMKDARVTDPKIKEACKNLIEAAEAQVITQKVSENYTGRRGPTIYLPVDRFDYDEKMGSTAFLKGTSYDKFVEMIFDAPLTRGVQDTFLAEANRWMEATKEAAAKNPAPAQEEEEKKVEESDESTETKKTAATKGAKSPKITEEVHSLEQQREGAPLASLGRVARGLVRLTGGLASGLVGAAIGGITGVVVGGLLGARAGFTGHSKHAQAYGADEDASTGNLASLRKGWSLVKQAVLFPVEATGLRVNDAVGFRLGKWPGRISGTLAGAVGGALGGGLVGAGLGSIPGFKVGHAAASAATFWLPGQLPSKDHSQGRDSDLTVP
jgi:hypothetical protein